MADAVTGASAAQDAIIQLRRAKGSASSAAQALLSQEGLQGGPLSSLTIIGDRAHVSRVEFVSSHHLNGPSHDGLGSIQHLGAPDAQSRHDHVLRGDLR